MHLKPLFTLMLAITCGAALTAADLPAAYAEGVKACEAGNFDPCEKSMTAAVRLAPKSAPEKNYTPWFYLGLAAYNQGEAAKAAACFDREAAFGVIGRTPQAGTFQSLRKVLGDRPAGKAGADLGPCAPAVVKAPAPASAPAPAPAPATQFPLQPVHPPATAGKNVEWFEHYDAGRKACDAGHWEDCAKEMESATAKQPASAKGLTGFGPAPLDYTPWYYLALAAFNRGQSGRGVANLNKEAGYGVIEQSSNAAAFRTLQRAMGEAHPLPAELIEAPPAPLKPGEIPPSPPPAPAVEVSDADSKSAQADYVKGVNLLLTEKFQEAADAFESALKKDPRPHKWTRDYGMWFEPYIPHYYLAICYYKLGKLDPARHHIRVSQMQELRGRLADQSGQLLDLSESIDKQERPDDPATLYTMTKGLNRMLTGDYDGAARVFEFLINAMPRWAEAHLYLGVCYYSISERYRESGDTGKGEEMRVLARKEFKAARKFDKRLTLSKIMLSPGLTDFWNKSLD